MSSSPSEEERYKDLERRYARINGSSRYDVEAAEPLTSPKILAARTLKRSTRGRNFRLAVIGVIVVGVVLYVTSQSGSDHSWLPILPDSVPGEKRPRPPGTAPPPDKLKGGWWPAPAPPPDLEQDTVHPEDDADYFVLDEYGDRFLPNVKQKYAPLHPNEGDLRDPALLFPEVGDDFLKPPKIRPFPESQMRDIDSEPPEVEDSTKPLKLPSKSYSLNWKGPANWNKPGPGVKDIQWPGFKDKSQTWETKEEAELRIARRDAVKRGFIYAWQKYKDHAWGHDEVKPKSKWPRNSFSGWGASIVDTLDTLLIMGLEEEYNLARPFVNQINFHWVRGRDWSKGYIAPASEADANNAVWMIDRDKTTNMHVFETGIRYLGGILGAYDLSGDKVMLDRALDIANILKKAFDTESGLPSGSRMDPGLKGAIQLGSVSLAEVGSMTLELMRLGQITGDRQWWDLAQRVTDFLEQKVAPRAPHPPLLPKWFLVDSTRELQGEYTFGAMADSFFEYLIKTYKLLGGGPLAEQYKRLYAKSIDIAKPLLFTNVTIMPDLDLLAIGKYANKVTQPRVEHLTCFAGGMLGMGARLLDREEDMTDGLRFTNTCFWLSQHMPTGIQPEEVLFYSEDDDDLYINRTTQGRLYHPPIANTNIDKKKMYQVTGGTWRFRDDHTPIDEDSGRGVGLPITYYKHLNGSPPGIKRMTKWYINRPETIESVFYMYRLTGDRKWQEKGWKMFTGWMENCKVDGGISSIWDVTKDPKHIQHSDNMESFIFAETFKYHYLLQSDPGYISLDDYVLNTEAHTFIANQKMKPGSGGFWTEPKDQDLGERGGGTDVQKWLRLKVLETHRRRAAQHAGRPPPPPVDDGTEPFVQTPHSGGGMGGGGGDPGGKPKPPMPDDYDK